MLFLGAPLLIGPMMLGLCSLFIGPAAFFTKPLLVRLTLPDTALLIRLPQLLLLAKALFLLIPLEFGLPPPLFGRQSAPSFLFAPELFPAPLFFLPPPVLLLEGVLEILVLSLQAVHLYPQWYLNTRA